MTFEGKTLVGDFREKLFATESKSETRLTSI